MPIGLNPIMGNIVSKKKTLRDRLIEIDLKIKFYESKKRNILKNEKSRVFLIYSMSAIFIIICILYSYFEDQSLIIYTITPCLISYTIKFLFTAFHGYNLEKTESILIDLREEQNDIIEKIKMEDDFYKTKELLDKLENNNQRVSYFSNVKQTKKSVGESLTNIVLGDDPTKTYALICNECHYHNGMIPPQEYDGFEFKCYNCDTLNKKSLKRGK